MSGAFTPEERDAIGAAFDRAFPAPTGDTVRIEADYATGRARVAPQRFRKLSVEIEARQFLTEKDGQQIAAWIRGYHGTDSAFWFADGPEGPRIVIHTLEGAMIASLGDWIIRGVQGEFYPCKPDIFAATYEAAASTATVQTYGGEARTLTAAVPGAAVDGTGTMTLYSPELGDALTAHAGTSLGGMVTGLYAVVQWIDEDGDQRIAIACAPDQTMIVTQGLLVVANNVADTELTTFVLDSAGNGE